jgi:hypothetical protein
MIFTKRQFVTIYIFEFLMNRNFTNEIYLSKLLIFTSKPCAYPYPTRTRFPGTRTLPVPVPLLPLPDPYPSTSYPYPGTGTGTRPAGCSTLFQCSHSPIKIGDSGVSASMDSRRKNYCQCFTVFTETAHSYLTLNNLY